MHTNLKTIYDSAIFSILSNHIRINFIQLYVFVADLMRDTAESVWYYFSLGFAPFETTWKFREMEGNEATWYRSAWNSFYWNEMKQCDTVRPEVRFNGRKWSIVILFAWNSFCWNEIKQCDTVRPEVHFNGRKWSNVILFGLKFVLMEGNEAMSDFSAWNSFKWKEMKHCDTVRLEIRFNGMKWNNVKLSSLKFI